MIRIASVLRFACIVLAAPTAPAAAADIGPAALVSTFQQGLLGVMKNARKLGIKGRYDRLGPIIERSFDLPVMIATASAPYWGTAPAAKRDRLVQAFRRMSVASAATLFDDYGGESFRTIGQRQGRAQTVIVDTRIVQPRDRPIDVSYVTARIRERWWIVDIIVGGGISELTVRRSEYQNLLRQGGIDRLVSALDRKANNLLAGREKAKAAGS